MELIGYAVLLFSSFFFIFMGNRDKTYFYYLIAATLLIVIGANLYNTGLIYTIYGANATNVLYSEINVVPSAQDSYLGILHIIMAGFLAIYPAYDIFVVQPKAAKEAEEAIDTF